ncbi:META domain-containing protein [Myroides indicus]|uniref:Heat shock protein HslJ n=1 Tax=Myroides indicus TaxID=1323422 RepID=A0A4R7EQT2_9FLAO|nr:hypothetical protein [Myroides indicus]TDS55302.1 heat shock protein HslJ [Myroides indicus]
MKKFLIVAFLSLGMTACSNENSTTDNNFNEQSIYGEWILFQIKNLETEKVRSPKDGNGIETNENLYFLTLQSDSILKGKTLANEFYGNYSIEDNSKVKLIHTKIDIVSEVLEPVNGDGEYFLKQIEGDLIYQLQGENLYLFFDNSTKCFIFKSNTM